MIKYFLITINDKKIVWLQLDQPIQVREIAGVTARMHALVRDKTLQTRVSSVKLKIA